jgi:arylsulfatase A-like enzyme
VEVQAGNRPARGRPPLTARISLLAILLATMVSLSGCGGNPVAPSVPPPAAVDIASAAPGKVAIISIDGLRPDALLTVGAPNILALADRGAYSWQAQTVLPSTTLPSHVSMLSGFTPEAHGMVWDDYIKERGPIPVPTLFSVARSHRRRTAVMAGKHKFTYFCEGPGSDVCAITSNGDDEVTSGAVSSRGADLLFVHLPDVDVNGHRSGWMSDAYLTAVRRADLAVGRIVSSLPADTTVILTADHGGHLSEHGSSQASDTTIPWIIAGPRIAQGRRLSSSIRTVDTAATAAYVLGFPLQPGAAGRPVLEAFATVHQTAAGLQTAQRQAASLPDR